MIHGKRACVLFLLLYLGCDRRGAAPQDLESGKAPTGTIEPARDRVDRTQADERPGEGGSAP